MEKSKTGKWLLPGRELAVVAMLRQMTARQLASRSGLPEWRVSRILAGSARPTSDELDSLRRALFGPGDSDEHDAVGGGGEGQRVMLDG